MSDTQINILKDKISTSTHLTGSVEKLDLLNKLFDDPKFFIETFLYIKNKRGRIVPFILNQIQAKYISLKTRFNIILKARQIGLSTLLLALEFREAIVSPGTNALIMAQDTETTQRLFDIIKLYYNSLPDYIKPAKKYSNRRELYFSDDKDPNLSLNSRLFISSPAGGGNSTVGRSSTINSLHLTEVAFWNNLQSLLGGLLESMPITEDSTSIVLESTPNYQNYFFNLYQMALQGKSMFKPIFFPWYANKEYQIKVDPVDNFDTYMDEDEKEYSEKLKLTKEALKWRRVKMSFYAKDAINEFRKEYPKDDKTCFLSFNTETTFPEKSYIYLSSHITDPEQKFNIFNMTDYKAWEEFDFSNYYIVAIDPAEGHENSDLTAVEIFKLKDEFKISQVCEYAARVSPIEVGKLVSTLVGSSKNYTVVVERNTGSAIHYILEQFNVKNIYRHTDGYLGFPMNRVSRPVIISKFLNTLFKQEIIIHSADLYAEIQAFKEHDKGAYFGNSHFDRIMSTMLLNAVVDKLNMHEVEVSSIDFDKCETFII